MGRVIRPVVLGASLGTPRWSRKAQNLGENKLGAAFPCFPDPLAPASFSISRHDAVPPTSPWAMGAGTAPGM